MIPPYISQDVSSNAEKKIFNLIKDSEEMDGFTCIHSLCLSRHLWKRQGEIDFVLIGDGVILCLEVKGGRISRKDGTWIFIDRFGQKNEKMEGPFAQASTAMYSLKSLLEFKTGTNHGYVFGHGVMFPDIVFNETSPEWNNEIVYDQRDTSKSIGNYIKRLRNYWISKIGNKVPVDIAPKNDIVNYFRGDFELPTCLWGDLLRTEDEIAYFTNEQYRALDHMENNPRVIFRGPAGTGKTLLAVEKARRLLNSKKRTLFLCFNRLLGVRLKKEMEIIDAQKKYLYANSIHKYFFQVIEKSGLKPKLDKQRNGVSPSDFYNEILPQIFLEGFNILGESKFDCLIIDEGQDLLADSYLIALDSVISGGLRSGNWTMFLDPGAQAKLFNRFSLEAYEYLKSFGVPEYKLDINVRNTFQVATQASVISGFPVGKTRIEGPKVEYITCSDESEMAIKTINLLDNLIKKDNVPPASVTLLSSRNINTMCLFTSGIKLPSYLIEATEENIFNSPKDKVLYSSAPSFKGLENNIIIYIDLDSLEGDYNQSTNYVAMTRARNKLYVLMDKRIKGEYQKRLSNFTNQN